MKIYILSIDKIFQPESDIHRYPPHNKNYGIEQDFLSYLLKHKELIADKPEEADWHYLPIFWTRWHVSHNHAKEGLPELQEEINKCILDDEKTFIICQYADGPIVNLGKTRLFLASRNNDSAIDIPLLSSPHKKPFLNSPKKYLASFVGRLSTHPLRQQMFEELKNRNDIFIYDGIKSSRFFVKRILQSYISLCPRGYGGSSFRFYESVQLGVVPFLIGDIDTRPFKKFINWAEISLYVKSVRDLNTRLDFLNKSDLILMGKKASKIWQDEFSSQNWCKYVIKELIDLKMNKKEKQKRELKKSKEIDKNNNISFIIPAYNCQDTITESVESIFNGNFCNGDELIVVDDDSTDNTAKVLNDLKAKYPVIKLLKHTRNKGGAVARNTAVENTENEILFCLDSDNVLVPGTIHKLKAYLLNSGADVAAFQELHYFKDDTSQVTQKWTFRQGLVTLADCLAGSVTPGASGNYMFTKESWIKAGGYPEFARTYDAWGFGFRQLATGAKMVVVPQSFYFHRHGHDSNWVREARKGNASLKVLQILLPFLDMFDRKDVDYMMSREGRYTWFENLKRHPIKLKTGECGKTGTNPQRGSPRIHVLKKLLKKKSPRIYKIGKRIFYKLTR